MSFARVNEKPDIRNIGLFSRAVLSVATLMTLTGTLIMVYEGFSRFFWGISFFWAEEAVRFLLVWAFFLTLGIAGFKQLHIRTELLVCKLPPFFQRISWAIACVMGLVFASTLAYSSIAQVKRYYTIGMLSESNLELPMWIVFLAMPVGGTALFIYYAYALWYTLRWGDPFGSELSIETELDDATVKAMDSKGS